MFKCNHCEVEFKIDKGLKIHIGKVHKSASWDNPEKQRSFSDIEEANLTLTPLKKGIREEKVDNDENTIEDGECDTRKQKCLFCPESDGFCKWEDCECLMTALGMNIHIIRGHEPNEAYNPFGRDWVMKYKQYICGTFDPN